MLPLAAYRAKGGHRAEGDNPYVQHPTVHGGVYRIEGGDRPKPCNTRPSTEACTEPRAATGLRTVHGGGSRAEGGNRARNIYCATKPTAARTQLICYDI